MDRGRGPDRGLDRVEVRDGHGHALDTAKETRIVMTFLHPWNPKSLRLINPSILLNPSRPTKIALGIGLAIVVGGVIYFGTRKAAAAKAAAKAFEVGPNCDTIEVVDDVEAKNSVIAAALVVRPGPSEPAVVAASQILAVLFPNCEWSTIPDDREFIHGDSSYTWGSVKLLLVGKSVSEVTSMVSGMQAGIVHSPIPNLFTWILGGR